MVSIYLGSSHCGVTRFLPHAHIDSCHRLRTNHSGETAASHFFKGVEKVTTDARQISRDLLAMICGVSRTAEEAGGEFRKNIAGFATSPKAPFWLSLATYLAVFLGGLQMSRGPAIYFTAKQPANWRCPSSLGFANIFCLAQYLSRIFRFGVWCLRQRQGEHIQSLEATGSTWL